MEKKDKKLFWKIGKFLGNRKGVKLTPAEKLLISQRTKEGMMNSEVQKKVNEANIRNKYNSRKAELSSIVKHHKNLDRLDNRESNILILPSMNLHRKLHARAYDYLVKLGLVEEYIAWFKNQYL